MNHLTQIFSTANRLQASRTFLRDLRGLDKTPEGIEFAKAIGNAAACGASAQEVVEEVVKAMGGNEGLALEVLESVQELAKAHVEHHTRTLANGKTVDVKAYESARTAAMKQTTQAHGATFHAMRTKTPEAHENAAAAHRVAAASHGDAHAVHPMDVPEVGEEHAKLKGQHSTAINYHEDEAKTMRQDAKYQQAKGKADNASGAVRQAYDTHQKVVAHKAAAEAHTQAATEKPGAGHEEQAEAHEMTAKAHEAEHKSHFSPLNWHQTKRAALASGEASAATEQAAKTGTREDHGKAAALHAAAIDHHMTVHGKHESDEDGHHAKVAAQHMELHAFHASKAAAKGPKEEAPVAKAEGAMTSMDGGTDIATKTGGAALAVEGRPGEGCPNCKPGHPCDEHREVSKAIVHAHTRTVGGKLVTVKEYESAQKRAEKASAGADAGGKYAHGYAATQHRLAGNDERAQEHARKHWENTAKDRAKFLKESGGIHDLAVRVNANIQGGETEQEGADEVGAKANESGDSGLHYKAEEAHGWAAARALNDGDKTAADHHTQQAAHHFMRRGHWGDPMVHPNKFAQEQGREVAKAEVAAHQRTQGGKVVQVSAYETHQSTAHAFATAAHKLTSGIGSKNGPEAHTAAAAAHIKAAQAHWETSAYAPEDWMKKGHESQANLHEIYATNHATKAKAAGQKADTGVNSAQHTEEDIKHLENHDDYQGFGYLGHSKRDSATDLALTQAANKAGIDRHELAAHLLSQSGRHMMDADEGHESEAQPKKDFEAKHARRVAHYQRWLTDPKNTKNYGIKDYAADLKKKAPKTPKE